MLFCFKPVAWNTNGYRGPSGAKFNSGFPKENGFGHEEWNNSPTMSFTEDGRRFKVFHTERLGKTPPDYAALAGRIAVMLIASQGGSQYLVGVAAGCIALHDESDRKERLRLAKRLALDSDAMAAETWAVPRVKAAFGGKHRKFLNDWETDWHWIPNWICPADLYVPLEEPVELDPQSLTGKQRLATMYNQYQRVDRRVFETVLSVVAHLRPEIDVHPLVDWAEASHDFDVEGTSPALKTKSVTERLALTQARLGQGDFRSALLMRWQQRCAVTGCDVTEMLRASHIRPWAKANNAERLNADNGLLLAAHLDALFDRGLISFTDAGAMLLSSRLAPKNNEVWGLGQSLRSAPTEHMRTHLAYHRKQVFKPQ